MGRKSHRVRKTYPQPKYRIAVHMRHKSGIGSTFIRYEFIDTKPNLDTHWLDETNKEWARFITAPFNRFER